MSEQWVLHHRRVLFRRHSATTRRYKNSNILHRLKFVSMANQPVARDVAQEHRTRLKELSNKMSKMFPGVQNVTAKELWIRLENPSEKIVLVDARLPEEAAVSMIPGNTLTLEEFEREKSQLRDHTVVAYCTVGYRSSQLARKLAGEGFQAANLEGSILAWTQEGFPLVRRVPLGDATSAAGEQAQRVRQEPTNRVHVFDSKWALQGEGFEPVAFRHPYLKYAAGAMRRAVPSWLGGSG